MPKIKKDLSHERLASHAKDIIPEPVGRPTEYRPEFCALLIKHMASGLSFESFGGLSEVEVSVQTLYNWRKVHQEFVEAYNVGREKGRLFWERIGVAGVMNRGGGKTLNTDCWKFNMKNRFGWRDKLDAELDKPPVVNVYQSVMERFRKKKAG